MKLNKICFSAIILLFVSIIASSQDNNITPIVSDEPTGVYIPVQFINELKRTNNYYEANRINGYYCINVQHDIIIGHYFDYHDIISPHDIIFNNNNCQAELIDKNGYKYIRISKDFDHYRAYLDYVTNHLFSIIYDVNKYSLHRMNLAKMEEGFFFNEKRWRLAFYAETDCNYVYFHYNWNLGREIEYECIGIKYIENEIIFYNLELVRLSEIPLFRTKEIIITIMED
jgi:hypothetical protein